jgi:hypothetical protein
MFDYIPAPVVFKPIVTACRAIIELCLEANADTKFTTASSSRVGNHWRLCFE